MKCKDVLLGDVCDISSSKRIFAREYEKEGIPFYRGKEIIEKGKGKSISTELFISREKYDSIKSKFSVPLKGEILLTSVGTLGVPWLIDEDEFYFKDGNLTWLRGKEGLLNEFLYYWLLSREAKEQIDSKCIGSTQKALTIDTLKKFSLKLPDEDTQVKIVKILKGIDNKIEINNRINKNLDEQIQTIFQEKFLSCGCLPLGWKKVTLGEVADISAGGDKPKNVLDHKTKEYKYPIYSNSISDEGLYGFTTGYKINQESVTVSARGTIGFVCIRHFPYTPIVRLITLVPNTSNISAKYLYLWLKSIHIQGTGTTQQQLTVPDFKRTEIFIPSALEMNEFTETVDPLFLKIWKNQEENVRLESIRDTLLPRLLTGELDLSYAVI